jgi:hypothetical protein
LPPLAVLLARPHTVGRFRLAAWGRYSEGNQLAVAAGLQNSPALRHGAIYLFGYVAELVLKAAYFRLRPANVHGTIVVTDMHNARNRATSQFHVRWPGANLHYLPGWAGLLTQERHAAGQPYDQSFATALFAHVNRLALLWAESIRYYYSRPSLAEVGNAHAAARWLVSQLPRL